MDANDDGAYEDEDKDDEEGDYEDEDGPVGSLTRGSLGGGPVMTKTPKAVSRGRSTAQIATVRI